MLPGPTQQQKNSEGELFFFTFAEQGWIPQAKSTPETELRAAEPLTPLK